MCHRAPDPQQVCRRVRQRQASQPLLDVQATVTDSRVVCVLQPEMSNGAAGNDRMGHKWQLCVAH